MNNSMRIEDYALDISLFEEYSPKTNMDEKEDSIVDSLLKELNEEIPYGLDYPSRRRLLYAKINTLAPHTFNRNAIDKLNRLLQLELREKQIIDAGCLSEESTVMSGRTKLIVWQGDITTLKIDAIVNAANSQLLGCFQPLHKCIDNVIHSAAGVQLRDDCDRIIRKQGFEEPTGTAKITRAYNLPSRFVVHTVGPIVHGPVTGKNRIDLSNVYRSCLDICREMKCIQSIAFCCVSTGVFGYPPSEAAGVAYRTVTDWLKSNPESLDIVVFNVFSDGDRHIYKSLVTGND